MFCSWCLKLAMIKATYPWLNVISIVGLPMWMWLKLLKGHKFSEVLKNLSCNCNRWRLKLEVWARFTMCTPPFQALWRLHQPHCGLSWTSTNWSPSQMSLHFGWREWRLSSLRSHTSIWRLSWRDSRIPYHWSRLLWAQLSSDPLCIASIYSVGVGFDSYIIFVKDESMSWNAKA